MVTFCGSAVLNSANLFPIPDTPDSTLPHDCTELLDFTLICFHHKILEHIPGSPNWFIDGSTSETTLSLAGYAITESYHNQSSYLLQEVTETAALPKGTFSEQAEFITLTRVFTLEKDKTTSVYTDYKYAYSIVHSNSQIWHGRKFLTVKTTLIQYGL